LSVLPRTRLAVRLTLRWMNFARMGPEWFGNSRGEVLSDLVVAPALIPEDMGVSQILT
jgi:hypothetical protein